MATNHARSLKALELLTSRGGRPPVAFVRSMNGSRRHLTASQRAITEVALNEWPNRGGQAKSAPGADSKPATAAQMAEAARFSALRFGK